LSFLLRFVLSLASEVACFNTCCGICTDKIA
jgi:hypothetical protein